MMSCTVELWPVILFGYFGCVQEGPTCIVNEEEFFDAVDASMDKLEIETESQLERARELSRNIIHHKPTANTPGAALSLHSDSRLWVEVRAKQAD